MCGWGEGLPLENLRNVPVFNQHGCQDWQVPIDASRYAVSRMQQLGYMVIHKEIPESGHNITGVYPSRDWMLTLRRVQQPAAVTFTCSSPDAPFNKAYWVTVREFHDPHASARVCAEVLPQGMPQSLSMRLSNVSVLELDVASMPIDREKDLLIQIDRDFIEQSAPVPEQLWVVNTGSAWSLADRWLPVDSPTRPYRSGAARNLFTGEPLMIVWGSRGPGSVNEWGYRLEKLGDGTMGHPVAPVYDVLRPGASVCPSPRARTHVRGAGFS